jgi:hypothetical protein
MNKKGQAAMEFLMTYGWAILVVLIAIGALAYFGVLNPGKYLPNSCTISNQFGCSEFKAVGGSSVITLVVQNGRGVNFQISPAILADTSINLTSPAAVNCPSTAPAINTTVVDGTTTTITFTCASALPSAGQKIKGNINIAYLDSSSALGMRFATGSLTTKTE